MNSSPWLIFLSVISYSLVHSLLASFSVKAWLRSHFGQVYERYYRLFYNLFAVLTLLPVLALPALLPDRTLYTIPFPWVVLTLVLQGLGALVVAGGVLQTGAGYFLGLEQLVRPRQVRDQELVVRGLYRCVRHPLYTGGLLLIWFLPVMTANLLALNIGLTLYLVFGALFEERKLVHEFGDSYQEYQRNTPMLLPCLKLTPKRKPER